MNHKQEEHLKSLKDWKEKYQDITEQEAKDLLNEVRQNLSVIKSDTKTVNKYFQNFCDDRYKHKITEYLLYFIHDANTFYYNRKDSGTTDHSVLKNNPIGNTFNEIKSIGTLATWEKYKGYIPLNVNNTRKKELFSMWLLLEIYDIYKLFQEEQQAKTVPEKKPLAEKIKWKAGNDLLKTHLEKLKDKFIQYKNIDAVMSGDEIAVFIKPLYSIIALFQYWDRKELIKGFIDKDNKKQYQKFILEPCSFKQGVKEKGISIIKEYNSDSFKSINTRNQKKTDEEIEKFESILI